MKKSTDKNSPSKISTIYRLKKEGPVHLIYVGQKHIGSIIQPVIGGSKKRVSSFMAISRELKKRSHHDNKKDAMTWLTTRSGASTKMAESIITEAENEPASNEAGVEGETQHSRIVKRQKNYMVKKIEKNPQDQLTTNPKQDKVDESKVVAAFFKVYNASLLRYEELQDREKNIKDPNAGPKVKDSDKNGDIEVVIKKTETGKPGDVIAINPKMDVKHPGQDTVQKPEHKKGYNAP